MVRYVGPTRLENPDTWRHVNLVECECTCHDWQDQQFPCLHAIHASALEQRRIDALYDGKAHSMETYLTCYNTAFTVLPSNASLLSLETTLKTPLDLSYQEDASGRRKPGPRPKQKRLLEGR